MSVHFNNDKLKKHRGMADQIKSHLTVADNNITEAESHSAYHATLPEGLTPEVVNKVADHNIAFNKAAHLAVGELAGEVFLADRDVEVVRAELGYFGKHDSVTMSVYPTKEFRNIHAKPGEEQTITKHLVINTTTTTNIPGLKGLRAAMSEEFAEMFSK